MQRRSFSNSIANLTYFVDFENKIYFDDLDVADSYARVGSCLEKMAFQEVDRELQRDLARGADIFEKLKKHEVLSSVLITSQFTKLGWVNGFYQLYVEKFPTRIM